MKYTLLYDNPDQDLISRLLHIRHIEDHPDDFFQPNFSRLWGNPFLLNDMEKSVERIISAIKNKEKIMIFGDYDVDGVTSSFILYRFFIKYLKYSNVSIQYPDRSKDGYGLKSHHLDSIFAKGVRLVITVDNGIASVQEAEYAKKLGLDLIITDHHHPQEHIPKAYAVINPLVSPDYPFKYLAGVGVAFKLICALIEKSKFDRDLKNQIFHYFLPIVAIGTVADVVPLIGENRAIVKQGLDLINRKPEHIPSSLKGFLNYLNIKDKIDTFHIGFVIGPRINAGGRIQSPYDSLKALLYTGDQQAEHLDKIEAINTERKKLQDEAFKTAEKLLNHEEHILVCASEDFHEGIVGIVAGRLTEKYNKPSLILKIDQEKQMAVGSLRGPDYFDVMQMISKAHDILERFGGHKCAGGLAVKLDRVNDVIHMFQVYCKQEIQTHQLEKTITVDTRLYPHERDPALLQKIDLFSPFGEGNEEPVFLIEDITILSNKQVGSKAKTHLKLQGKFGDHVVSILCWGKGEEYAHLSDKISLVGKVKRDNFNGGWYIEGSEIIV